MHEIKCAICLFTIFIKKITHLLFPDLPKSQCVRYREVNREAIDHVVPKTSVRYIEGLL